MTVAFKGMATEEIYDVLMEQLLKAIRKYDPDYSEKTREVFNAIHEKLSRFPQFTVLDVNRHLGFDGLGHLRMLVRRGHLETVLGPQGRVAAYRRKVWPPEPKLFNGGPIGLTYCIQTWFRYYLQQWIDNAMSEIESREGVYSLDFGREAVMAGRDRQERTGSSSQGVIEAMAPTTRRLSHRAAPPPWR